MIDLSRLATALSDRYRIERELGAGGMATVYLAHDVKHDRKVALKVLHQHLAQELGAERFLSEIKTTARLRHPHILPLFDSGIVEHGGMTYMYYVMPYIDGISLRDRLTRDRQLSVDEAIRITIEVAGALEHAHAHGVVHRDIKPENIMLEGGHALVADFGIALAPIAPGAARITQTGTALGTPAYMSPEQSAGERDIDARSDEYSVACVLFEMLTGEPPFAGPTVESILVQRFTKVAPRVTSRRASVPRHLDVAVHTAMARDPGERFSTMARFAEALTPPQPKPIGSQGPKSVAVLPFANMSGDKENEYFGDGIAEEIINALAQLPGLHVAARTSAFSFKGKNEDLRGIGAALNVETVLEGSVRKSGNRVRVMAQLINVADGFHLWSERYDRELHDIFAIQDEIALAIAAKLKITLDLDQSQKLVRPPTANVEAYESYLKAQQLVRARGRGVADSIEHYERAIALDAGYAAPQAGLARALILLAFWGLVHPHDVHERARIAARRAMALDPSSVDAIGAAALAAATIDLDIDRAKKTWDSFPPLDPANADAHVQRASFDRCYIRGEFGRGIGELRAVIAADPLSAYAVAQLSVVLGFTREYESARAEAVRAIALDPNSTFAHWALIHACAGAGDVAATRGAFDAAVARLGRGSWFLMGLAMSVRDSPDRAIADAVFDELTARSRTTYVQPAALGAAAVAAGRLDEGMELLRHAADIRDPLLLAVIRHWPLLDAVRSRTDWPDLLRRAGHSPS